MFTNVTDRDFCLLYVIGRHILGICSDMYVAHFILLADSHSSTHTQRAAITFLLRLGPRYHCLPRYPHISLATFSMFSAD